jgi:DNA-binding transcriptional LysR family regulator
VDVRHLSFRLLQVYVQVVRLASVSAAARQLHLTQPTVSLQLKKLADEVGQPLLEYREGKVHTTYIGDALFQAASDVLSRFDDFSSLLEEAKGGRSGTLSLGIVTTAKYVMPTILGAFDKANPKIAVTLNVGNRAHILNRFGHQDDDLYLFSQPPSGELVQACRIIKNPLQLIAPADHWASRYSANGGELDFSELKNERFLMREPGSATRMQFESWLSSQGVDLSKTMQIESNEAIRLSVASGLGLAVLSTYTLGQSTEQFSVLKVKGFPLNSHWYLVARKDKRLSASARRLIQFIAEHLTDCIEERWVVEDIQQLPSHFYLPAE